MAPEDHKPEGADSKAFPAAPGSLRGGGAPSRREATGPRGGSPLQSPRNVRRDGGAEPLSRWYSRKASSSEGPYRPVGGRGGADGDEDGDDAVPQGVAGNLVWRDTGFELLTSSGFPLFLRGDVGLAWYDAHTTVRSGGELVVERQADEGGAAARHDHDDITLRVQRCPTVLRRTVCDLFPYGQLEKSELSVVSITLKPDLRRLRTDREAETEKLAQTFLMAAKGVCEKLRAAGYWADFVNPFSGRPYLVPDAGTGLYGSDNEKFRCLDFQIFQIDGCKVVSNEADTYSKRRFTGSLFTSAPCESRLLDEVLAKGSK